MSSPAEKPREVGPQLFPFPLSEASVGAQLWIHSVEGNPRECHRLHEMGFCRRAELVKLSHGAMTVCLVCGARVGLSETVAQRILVTVAPGEPRENPGNAKAVRSDLSSFAEEGTLFCRIRDRFRRRKGGAAG